MFAALDVTPVLQPIVQWVSITPGAYSEPPRGSNVYQTPLAVERTDGAIVATSVDPLLTSPTPGEGLLGPAISRADQVRQRFPERHHQGKVDQIAAERIVLLARKYAGNDKDRELRARLEVLGQKLLTLAPRVTVERVAKIESHAATIESIRIANIERDGGRWALADAPRFSQSESEVLHLLELTKGMTAAQLAEALKVSKQAAHARLNRMKGLGMVAYRDGGWHVSV